MPDAISQAVPQWSGEVCKIEEYSYTLDQVLRLAAVYKCNNGKLSAALSVAKSEQIFPTSYGPVFVLELLEKIQRTDQGEWGVWDFPDGSSWEGPMIYEIQPTGGIDTPNNREGGE